MGASTSSIAKKIFMSLSGLFLISFLVIHLSINLLTLFSAEAFNEASHFMATNPVIQVMQYVLALGFIVHIVMGIKVTIQNRAARPIAYASNKPSANSNWSSRNMIVTGMLVLLFLVIHIKNLFWTMKFGDMNGMSDYELVTTLFTSPLFAFLYVFAFVLLGFHLDHGFQSAFQSVGANHNKYTPMIKSFGRIFSIVIAIGFSCIALKFFFFPVV
ncbi:MAG: succinate dehydrogenase / fumarate reductase cytochrome b subunit [Bacteroidia bacterium]|jgi:succinate dehydrogenase / fumarate reductase cytochrome b subunit